MGGKDDSDDHVARVRAISEELLSHTAEAERERLAREHADANGGAAGRHYFVGARVTLKGTGKYWTGGVFRATIVDIRAADDTVKVQYDDGGFKRFPKVEFEKLFGEEYDADLDFGTRDYEWSDDQFNPVTEVESELTELRAQLRGAVMGRNFMRAKELKEVIDTRTEAASKLRHLEYHLRQAVEASDFQRAHDINTLIEDLRRAQLEGAGTDTKVDLIGILKNSGRRALGSGLAGAAAMVVQVTSLMWMRTAMNYQYKTGSSMRVTFETLYKEGGIRRFYRGYLPALAQGPLSRFGDTAANVGVLTLLNSSDATRDLPIGVKTFMSSGAAAGWRILLMPIDTVKTTLQVNGKEGMAQLAAKTRASGPAAYFHGSIGASAATFAGHYPWFATYNALDASIPVPDDMLPKLARNASLGFCASAVSDTVSNSLRVLKTVRQTNSTSISYMEAANQVIAKDGVSGLFSRGLKTRIAANGMQGMMFSVAWKYLDDKWKASTAKN